MDATICGVILFTGKTNHADSTSKESIKINFFTIPTVTHVATAAQEPENVESGRSTLCLMSLM